MRVILVKIRFSRISFFFSDVSGEVWGAVLPVHMPQGTHSVLFRKWTSLLGLLFRRGYSVPPDKICKSNDKSM